jgi:hypothetical protein
MTEKQSGDGGDLARLSDGKQSVVLDFFDTARGSNPAGSAIAGGCICTE